MANAYCSECDGRIRFNPHVSLGQKVICPHCDADFEVIGVALLELDWICDWSWEDEEEEDKTMCTPARCS